MPSAHFFMFYYSFLVDVLFIVLITPFFVFISYIQRLRKISRIFWPHQITDEELRKRTKQHRIDSQISEMQAGMAGPHTAKTARRYGQVNPRLEPPKGKGSVWDRGIRGEERCSKRPKELRRPERRSKLMLRIAWEGGSSWKPYVPWQNDGMSYI